MAAPASYWPPLQTMARTGFDHFFGQMQEPAFADEYPLLRAADIVREQPHHGVEREPSFPTRVRSAWRSRRSAQAGGGW